MKTYPHRLSLLLFCSILCCVAACETGRESTRQPKVHALFILLKNDTDAIRRTVDRNEKEMLDLMQLVSRHCEVNVTLMESHPGIEGEVTDRRFVNNESKAKREYPQPDIIKPDQVIEWLSQVKTGPMDTLLIYFSGHGKMGRYGDHLLLFDKTDDENRLSRDVLEARLDEKPARLKMLITDTCSQMATEELLSRKTVEFVGVEPNARFFAKNLFLEHTGFLNITAASPGKLAYGDTDIGGYFTSAIADSLNSDTDKDPKDNFLSWIEVFNAAKEKTQKLAEQATPPKIQTPVAHLLPKSLRDTAEPPPERTPSSPEEPAHPAIAEVQTTATLNVTSTPNGATVYVDGTAIGTTPRTYEVELGFQTEKSVEVGLSLEGYKQKLAHVTLKRGEHATWQNVPLEKKAVQFPQRITGNDGAEMVLIPAGEFQMGSNSYNDAKPVHTVYVDAFYMDVYEVTNAQFKAFVDANPQWRKARIPSNYHGAPYLSRWSGNSYPSGQDDYPVICGSWYAAMAYAEWAGKRLPTEAEWEKAARGGLQGQRYPWGNEIDANKANYGDNLRGFTAVGSYGANGYGLYDMAGNMWEWCLDAYDADFYARSPRQNPLAGEMTLREVSVNYRNVTTWRVMRGGSWLNLARGLRVASRAGYPPGSGGRPVSFSSHPNSEMYFGFRCAMDVTP